MLTIRIEGAPERLTLGCHGNGRPLLDTWIFHQHRPISAPIFTLTTPLGLAMTGMVGLHALIAVTTLALAQVNEVTF
jgi:hypothetical protein